MADFVSQRLLRTGELGFSATTATDVDQYIVTLDDQVEKSRVAELFVSYPNNPRPRGTLKQLGTSYLICDRVTVTSAGKNASLVWYVHVHWKELESDNPQSQDRPTPNSNSTNPNDWRPTWTKRTHVVYEPAKDAFYRGGYKVPGLADQRLKLFAGTPADPDADPPVEAIPATRAPILNSALQSFARRPEHRRLIEIWSFRWLRPACSSALLSAENKVNSVPFTINLPGIDPTTWEAETALIDSVNLSNQRWGYLYLVEINVEIVVDPNGHSWKILDEGTAARAIPGIDPDGEGGTVSGIAIDGKPQFRQLQGSDGEPLQDPVLLNGDGQPLVPTEDPVFGDWMDFGQVDFNSTPLVEDL